MPTPKKGARLGGSPAHQRLIVANLATALFEHGRITTTEAKARVLRPVAEKLITKAKKAELGTVQSLHNRREVLKTIHDKSVVHALFTEIAPTFAERPGGYTRITKIGPRKGDNAPMAVIELVTESYTPSAPKASRTATTTAPAAAGRAACRRRPRRGGGDRRVRRDPGGRDRGLPTSRPRRRSPRRSRGSRPRTSRHRTTPSRPSPRTTPRPEHHPNHAEGPSPHRGDGPSVRGGGAARRQAGHARLGHSRAGSFQGCVTPGTCE